MGCDGGPYWRTTDAGTTWTKVSPDGIWAPHGGNTYIYYAKNGTLYCDAVPYPMRSTDNGATWVTLTNLPYAWYETAVGDGERLYASPNSGGFYTSPESDGKNWTRYTGTSPTVGAYMMRFDSVNRIMYATCKDAGVWALKLAGTTVAKGDSFYRVPVQSAGSMLRIGKTGATVCAASGRLFDVRGRNLMVR
jgi:hypothetical protein